MTGAAEKLRKYIEDRDQMVADLVAENTTLRDRVTELGSQLAALQEASAQS